MFSRRLIIRLTLNHIASWGLMIEKIIFIYLQIKKKNLNGVKCIKDEDLRVLIKEKQIKERWESCFDKNFMEAIQKLVRIE
jgi:biopolymer transport protein ExbB/TolQ